MEIKVEKDAPRIDRCEQVPLLANTPKPTEKTPTQKAISRTLESTAHLANLLPTGSVLAFQLLAPIFASQGQCGPASQTLTVGLVTLCGLSCFLLSFTDSFKDQEGNVCYGFTTPHGLWVIDGSTTLPPELGAKYRVRFIDFMHALMSIMVFAAVALFNHDVVNCCYPAPSVEMKELLMKLPFGFGVICSLLFVAFPTHRHGIGFPVTSK